MRRIIAVLAGLMLLAGLGCPHAPVEPGTTERYTYASYDTNGVALVTGWFMLHYADDSTITGEWHFNPVGNPQNIGPQTGNGILAGGVENGEVWVELNPQFRDNNLQLTGMIQGNRYAGEWAYISFIGVTNHGPFEAFRR